MSKKLTLRSLSKVHPLKKSTTIESFQKFFISTTKSSATKSAINSDSQKTQKSDLAQYEIEKSNVYVVFSTKALVSNLMIVVKFDLTIAFEVLLAFNTKAKDSSSKKLTPIKSLYNDNYFLDLLANTEKLAIKAKPTVENSYQIYVQRSLKFMESTDVRFIKNTMQKTFKVLGLGAFYEKGQNHITIADPVSKIKIELMPHIPIRSIQNLITEYWSEESSIPTENLFEVTTIGDTNSPIIAL